MLVRQPRQNNNYKKKEKIEKKIIIHKIACKILLFLILSSSINLFVRHSLNLSSDGGGVESIIFTAKTRNFQVYVRVCSIGNQAFRHSSKFRNLPCKKTQKLQENPYFFPLFLLPFYIIIVFIYLFIYLVAQTSDEYGVRINFLIPKQNFIFFFFFIPLL